jgi:hypothetical protein
VSPAVAEPAGMEAGEVLRSLARAVREGRTLAWCVAHAGDGVDPLAPAWAACADSDAVYRLCVDLWPGRSWHHSCGTHPEGRLVGAASCAGCAEALREAAGALTLADVLAASRRGT